MTTRREAIANSAVATGKGDDGTTGLLYGSRVGKDDPRTEAYGTVDEAVAALGMARVELGAADLSELAALILRFQRELFVVASASPNPSETIVTRLKVGIRQSERSARRSSRPRSSKENRRACITERGCSAR